MPMTSELTGAKSRRRWFWALCVFLGFAGLSFSLPGQAQRKRITLDELVIEGTVQKPEAFFILPRASLNFEELQRREDLKRRIIESVRKKPF